MGKLALAAKITHVPSMYLSELDGPAQGLPRRPRSTATRRSAAAAASWASTPSSCSTCTGWSTANTTSTAAPQFEGIYTSNELPHFIKNMPYAYPGQPGARPADRATWPTSMGVKTPRALATPRWSSEYGTLVPMRYMNADQHFKVMSVSALVHVARPARQRRASGWPCARRSRSTTTARWRCSPAARCRTASPHNGRAPEFMHKVWTRSSSRSTARVVELWKRGRLEDLHRHAADVRRQVLRRRRHARHRDAARRCWAGTATTAPVEIVTPYFGSSGTGQINAIFPVTPLA